MKKLIQILSLAALLVLTGCMEKEYASPVESNIHKTFKELNKVRMMKRGKEYRILVDGVEETGVKEQFLRRRQAEEILSSKLSSGCGDYALACISKLAELGERALLIDAAEVSRKSMDSRFAGHSVVAVLEPGEPDRWWLVDPAARRILSRDWNLDSEKFEVNGKQFWIGYAGKADGYPVKDPQSLRDFYDSTLNDVPQEIIECLLEGETAVD